jgi:hypothetical protein
LFSLKYSRRYLKVLGNAAKPSFCDNIAKLRKVASKVGLYKFANPAVP